VKLDARNETDPDLAVEEALNKTDIIFVNTALLDAYPLVLADIIALRFVVLVDRCHLVGGQQCVLIQHEVQIGAGFLHVNLLEGFNVDVALS